MQKETLARWGALGALALIVGLSGCQKAPRKRSDPAANPGAGMTDPPAPMPTVMGGAPITPTPKQTPEPRPPAAYVPTADQRAAAQGASKFAVALFAQIKKTDGNLFFSPWSINTAIGMTYAGAKGATEKQMAQVMHYALPQAQLHPAIGTIQRSLIGAKGYELAVANRVFPQAGLKLSPTFVSLLAESYGSKLQALDYKKDPGAARQVINDWVKKQTRGRIPALLQPPDVTKRSRMALVNAIYFKGSWASKFDKARTKPADFHLAKGKSKKAPLMHQINTFGYRAHADVDVLEMGYVGKRLSMVVLLPKKREGLASLEKRLTHEELTKLTTGLRRRKVEVYLPKFELASRFDLKAALGAMGMPVAFSNAADFSGMEPTRRLKISKVVHQANCDVGEEGTVAAAATAVMMKTRGRARPAPPPVFRADHPFLFLIRDRQTGVTLFFGRVAQP